MQEVEGKGTNNQKQFMVQTETYGFSIHSGLVFRFMNMFSESFFTSTSIPLCFCYNSFSNV